MKKLHIRTISAAAAALMLAATASANTDRFTTAQHVPNDVFLYVAGRDNPERAFLQEYWGEVLEELKASGVGGDALDLIGSFLDADGRAEMERIKTHLGKLWNDVDWEKLGGGEFTFTERLGTGLGDATTPNEEMIRISAGPPDMAWIMRGEGAAENYDALLALVRGVFDDINRLSNSRTRLIMAESNEFGARTARLTLCEGRQDRSSVMLTMTADGAEKLHAVTKNNLGERMAIVLDGKVLSGPISIQSAISEYAVITGSYSEDELAEIAGKVSEAVKEARTSESGQSRLQVRFVASDAAAVEAEEFDAPGSDGTKLLLAKDVILDEGDVQSAGVTAPSHRPSPIVFALAQRGNTVAAFMGEQMMADVLGLMEGTSKKTALADDERFKQAFAQLPPAEDTMVFFDMQSLMRPVKAIVKMIPMMNSRGSGDLILNSATEGPIHELTRRAWEASQKGDYEEALTLTQKAYETAPTDSRVLYNLACFHALTGDKEKALTLLGQAVEAGFYAPNHIVADTDLDSLRDDARYAAALDAANAHYKTASGDQGVDMQKAVLILLESMMDAASILNYSATVEWTDGYSTGGTTITALTPGAESNRFYKVFAKPTGTSEFDRYLPAETESFYVGDDVSLGEFYKYIEDSFNEVKPEGEDVWAKWQSMQAQFGIDIKRDVLDWVSGGMVSVTLADQAGSAWLIKIENEETAREKVGKALDFLHATVQELCTQNPGLSMLSFMRSPATYDGLEDFEELRFMTSPQPIVWGTADGYLMIGSAEAIDMCLRTGRGEHPNIRENGRVMAEALTPTGSFTNVMFTDQRRLGENIATGIGVTSMIGGMASMAIPDQDVKAVIGKISGMLGKLIPAVRKIDFIKSQASCTTFDGKAWRTEMKTHYATPEERQPSQIE